MKTGAKTISVITLNKDRTDTLVRCVESVMNQDYEGEIEHVIVGDQSESLIDLSSQLSKINPKIVIRNFVEPFPPEVNPIFSVSKIGFLRNFGVSVSKGAYITQLGDDDFGDSDHISSLVETIESEPDIGVAFCWRRMVDQDGVPVVIDSYPWAPNARHITSREDLAEFIFSQLVKQGVRCPGSPVIKDAVLGPNGEEIFTVDTNCVLVKREVHDKIPWKVEYSWREICGDYSDDHRFVESCYRAGIKIKGTEAITLNYSMGGASQPPSR